MWNSGAKRLILHKITNSENSSNAITVLQIYHHILADVLVQLLQVKNKELYFGLSVCVCVENLQCCFYMELRHTESGI